MKNLTEYEKGEDKGIEVTGRKLNEWEEAALKKAYIQIRIEESLKNEFYSKCEKNFQTPSVVLRGLIKKFIEEEN